MANLFFEDDIHNLSRHFSTGCQLLNNYGSTECPLIARFVFRVGEDFTHDQLPAGFSPPEVDIELANTSQNTVATTTNGEILATSECVGSGYWRAPELTYLMFSRNDDGRMTYRTGDLGYLDESGCLFSSGRVDDQVKIRGHRVLPLEVESCLLDHADVTDVAVRSYVYRHEELRLAAYVLVRENSDVTELTVRHHARETLPSYRVPTFIRRLTRLPREQGWESWIV